MQKTTIREIQDRGMAVAMPRPVAMSVEALEGKPSGTIIAQQGDIYLAVLSALPSGCSLLRVPHGQLVPGTSQGARHCVDSSQVTLWQLSTPTILDGPIIEAPEGCTVTHPEHGHITLPPGIYRVTYQRQYATELQRVID